MRTDRFLQRSVPTRYLHAVLQRLEHHYSNVTSYRASLVVILVLLCVCFFFFLVLVF